MAPVPGTPDDNKPELAGRAICLILFHPEEVYRLQHIEGHDSMRHLVQVFLPGFGKPARAAIKQQNEQQNGRHSCETSRPSR